MGVAGGEPFSVAGGGWRSRSRSDVVFESEDGAVVVGDGGGEAKRCRVEGEEGSRCK